MSMVPHYLQGRNGAKFGTSRSKTAVVGRVDRRVQRTHMGNCAELCARRKHQPRSRSFAVETAEPRRQQTGKFGEEVVPVSVPNAEENLWWWIVTRNTPTCVWTRFLNCALRLTRHSHCCHVDPQRWCFCTGAAGEEAVAKMGLALAKFTLQPMQPRRLSGSPAPSPAPKALTRQGWACELWELNEAFSVVGCQQRALGLNPVLVCTAVPWRWGTRWGQWVSHRGDIGARTQAAQKDGRRRHLQWEAARLQ